MHEESTPDIDIPQLIRNMGGNDKIIPKLLETFWFSCDDCWQKLDAANKSYDLRAWKHAAHELKGAALSITANRIATLCLHAEKLEQLQNSESHQVLMLLQQKVESLRADLKHYSARVNS